MLMALIGSFSALVALTAFHAFILVHKKRIESPFYREFASFFGRGASIPILMLYAFAILLTGLDIAGLDYQIVPISNCTAIFKGLSFFLLGLGWYFTIVGITLVTVRYLRDHLVIDIYFK
jgi:hypothetical protein